MSTNKFSVKDLPCESVVVYQDRAEVKRLIKTKLNKGENELVLNNISNNIEQDSVRVEGRGDATVIDVVCQNKSVVETDESASEKVKQLKIEIKELEKNEQTTKLKLDRILKQISVLNDFASCLSKPVNNTNSNGVITASDNFMSFLDSYSGKLEQLDDSKFQIERDLNVIREQLNVARDNLNRLNFTNISGSDSM